MAAKIHVLLGIDANSLLLGARRIEQELTTQIAASGLKGVAEVVITGSIGPIDQGVVLAVYPEGVTYTNVTVDDVAEIVQEHLLNGRPVKRLQAVSTADATGTVAAKESIKGQTRIVLENCGKIDPSSIEEAKSAGAYSALAKIAKRTHEPGVGHR